MYSGVAIQQAGPATCVQTIAAHMALVDGLAFSPDGSILASCGSDGTVKLWDTSILRPSSGQAALSAGEAGGGLRGVLAGHTGRPGRVAWSPDGRTLAVSGYDPTIWLWDVQRSTYRATLQGHTDGVCGLAFTPDSRTLLSCGNGALRVWDATSGQSMHVIQGYEDFLYVVDWSPDGTQLVSGSMDALVTIWDMAGATPPRTLGGHRGSVCGVGWSRIIPGWPVVSGVMPSGCGTRYQESASRRSNTPRIAVTSSMDWCGVPTGSG